MLRSLREAFKLWMAWWVVPIRSGPLKGMKWIASSGANFIRGTYEEFKTEGLLKVVRRGDVSYDIGGHVGYYAIVESVLAGDQGEVYVFEPRPLNIAYIKRHIEINGISNVHLVEAAVSDRKGEARFETRTGTGTGHMSDTGNLSVSTVIIDELVESGSYPPPNFIKIDVEGAEASVLKGARRTIEKWRPNLLVATHGEDEHRFVIEFLETFRYDYEILNEQAIKGDTEIIAIARN